MFIRLLSVIHIKKLEYHAMLFTIDWICINHFINIMHFYSSYLYRYSPEFSPGLPICKLLIISFLLKLSTLLASNRNKQIILVVKFNFRFTHGKFCSTIDALKFMHNLLFLSTIFTSFRHSISKSLIKLNFNGCYYKFLTTIYAITINLPIRS